MHSCQFCRAQPVRYRGDHIFSFAEYSWVTVVVPCRLNYGAESFIIADLETMLYLPQQLADLTSVGGLDEYNEIIRVVAVYLALEFDLLDRERPANPLPPP